MNNLTDLTIANLKHAVREAFKKHGCLRMPTQALSTILELDCGFREEVIEEFFAAEKALGSASFIMWTKGKMGGVSIRETDVSGCVRPGRLTENVSIQKEKPCRNCSKNNDIGVSKCWWCECLNPTS